MKLFGASRTTQLLAVFTAVLMTGGVVVAASSTAGAAVDPCAPIVNPVACENSKPGTPPAQWDIGDAGDPSIQGFATQASVNVGETVHFKVDTDSTNYQVHIFRMGYYQGNGARQVATFAPQAHLPQTQPPCLTNQQIGLVDCGNWADSATWTVPTNSVSGVFMAAFERIDNDGNAVADSETMFVVRNDASHSDILASTSDATWAAYNTYGGYSLYQGTADTPNGRAYKVSYNRPNISRGGDSQNTFFGSEFPMVRFMERNGYDVSYTTNVDTDVRGSLILNHKVFMSMGHDEYWSSNMRTNVQAAPDAGVNLAFLSGNTMFWKTRYEPSVDGSNTAARTLVTYKETSGNVDPATVDPTGQWTGTWRDPRHASPPNGGFPENQLVGVMSTVDGARLDSLSIPSTFSRLRYWRNTSIATLPSGSSYTFGAGTLGYEWGGDVDNGFRPSGLVDLSSTSVAQTSPGVAGTAGGVFDAYGETSPPGGSTHNFTLYRAASGALVFGAEDIQYSWALDATHDNSFSGTTSPPIDVNLQQATINLLADMKAQPATLMAGLVAAAASTDTTAPTATISAPAAGSTVFSGHSVNITGTAADNVGGGTVAGVQVSTDGSTWHLAQATGANGSYSTWSYAWTPSVLGAATVQVKAIDDSGNTQTTSASRSFTVGVSCPCNIFSTSAVPGNPAANDTTPVEVGVKFRSELAGQVTGVRFYKGAGNTGTHTGSLWNTAGNLLATGTFTNETASGWQQLNFSSPVTINPNTTYIVSAWEPNGHYPADLDAFTFGGVDNAPLHALKSGVDGANGVFRAGSSGFPTDSFRDSNYWVDVVWQPTPPDTTIPTVVSRTPANGAANVARSVTPSVVFSEAMNPASISITMKTAANVNVPGTVSYDSTHFAAVFTPSALLSPSTSYTVTLAAASDVSGNPAASSSSTFSTSTVASCPCSIWPATTVPTVASTSDTTAVNVGVKFTADSNGYVSAVRFYKGALNTGNHTGTLWSASGQLLASTTFVGEGATGWQTAYFSQPVAVTANTTYIAAYSAPNGGYAMTWPYFSPSGVDNPPLHASADSSAGGNGVYAVGGSTAFPTNSFQAANYWVDVVYASVPTAITVTSTTPAAGATNQPTNTTVSATFSLNVTPASIGFTLQDASNVTVPGTVSYSSATRIATFTPTASLATGTTYHATVSGANDGQGNAMGAPVVWSFTTAGVATCPCSIFPSDAVPAVASWPDTTPVEVGVKFTADANGFINGIRFYKGPTNTGTHTASLWTTNGTRLATATFSAESASGWQSVSFSSPVAVAANTTYIASMFAPNGGYAANAGYFNNGAVNNAPLHAPSSGTPGGNGVYAVGGGFPTSTYNGGNYWVDVAWVPDNTPPPAVAVTATTPASGATNELLTTTVTAKFSSDLVPASLGFTLQDASNATVAGTVSYSSVTDVATFTPSAPLSAGSLYRATVTSATGTNGSTLAAPVQWTFTTTGLTACPCSIFPSDSAPGVASWPDGTTVEVGVKFTSDANGFIRGIRFYKGAANTGTHTASLWSTNGTRLATATFSGESATGWQSVSFATPVAVTANTTYIASYFAPNGGYAADPGYFNNGNFDNGPLHTLRSNTSGGNGVYAVGGGFPTSTYGGANYWVDVAFTTS